MTTSNQRLLTEICLEDGYCFVETARLLVKEGRIKGNDPRNFLSKEAQTISLPTDKAALLSEWEELVSSGVAGDKQAGDLTDEIKMAGGSVISVAKRCATFFEALALQEFAITGLDKRVKYLFHCAARYCDVAVLESRHRDEKRSFVSVSEQSGVTAREVVIGMMRTKLLSSRNPTIMAMVEGQFSEMDELKRKPFYAHSKKYLALSQVEELQSLGLDPEIYSKVVIAAYRLRDSQKMTDSREIMEAEVLWASAHLAESFSAAWQTTDLERSKSLGAIAFSASERAADVLSNYPDKFFGAQLHKRYREVR